MMLITFLQALYNRSSALPIDEEEYRSLQKDIKLFAIAPQIYAVLKMQGRLQDIPAFFEQWLKETHTRVLYHNLYMKHKEEEILKALEQWQIHAIPLKGINFADRYFGHIGARVTGDIDIYIPLNRLEEAIECVKEQGYVYEITKDHHARLHLNDLTVELHWTLDKEYWSDLNSHAFWQSSENLREYQYIKQLSTPSTFYFICLHSARHQMDSIRYLLDIVQMLDRCGDEIDYEALFQQADQDKTLRRVLTVLSIVYEQFPHLQQTKPLPYPYIDSRWNYESIKNAKMGLRDWNFYRYKLHFKHLIFDSWKYTLKSIKKSY
ncbi:MAG: nucleotidyltransferase family protein [Candidatus Cohnella colombiensis]|uniref:Nucleotidyltransferase family protein n=1 Tax=Candidatus Cohnella colombiensis TaxID=3121368 RepID=A0AA95JC84_9BACL|nr:MAG: nucleotidyltransferase family protein [Cohnella sp.]